MRSYNLLSLNRVQTEGEKEDDQVKAQTEALRTKQLIYII